MALMKVHDTMIWSFSGGIIVNIDMNIYHS